MEKRVPEHLNMDSAAGNMPPPPVPEKLKQKLPKGELNPYAKHTAAPHQSEKIQKKHASGEEMEKEQLAGNWAKSINLLSPGDVKQDLINEKALEEVTKVSEEELQKRDKQIFQTWIQQNPVQAAVLGIDKDDPFEEKKGKSPAKYYKKSPLKRVYGTAPVQGVQHMGRAQAFKYGQEVNKDWATQAGVAGGQMLQEKLEQWDQERQQYQAKLKAQQDREAKELFEVSKPLVQTLDNSAALDESTKNLLAQQWKQGFVENEKKYKAGEIDQYEYALNKAQSLNNANQYQQAVGNLTQASQQFGQLLKDDKISNAMTEEARDFYTSIAAGKGMNITSTQDGKKVANNGLSIQNVNGQPTMVGWTAGQIDQARQAYQQLQQPDPVTGIPKITAQNTSFEAFLGSVARPGDPTYEEMKKDPMYAQWIDGVNIPVANLASGEGMPEMVQKDDALDQNVTAFADDIAQKAVNSYSGINGTSTDQLWGKAAPYASEYTTQMLDNMGEQQIRAMAADVANLTPQDIRRIMDTEGGLPALKKELQPELLKVVKTRFEANPDLAAMNKEYRAYQQKLALQNAKPISQGRGPKTEDAEFRLETARLINAAGNGGDWTALSGRGNIATIKPVKGSYNPARWNEITEYIVTDNKGNKVKVNADNMKQEMINKFGVKPSELGEEETPQTEQQIENQNPQLADLDI